MIQELQKLFPGATSDTWHQHPNGGGWVQNTATVAESAYVGINAQVFGDAWVFGNARVRGKAQVSGHAVVCGNAQVYGKAQVCGNARVFGDVRVYGNARVCGDAWVYGKAQVCGNARVSGDTAVYGNARLCGYAQVFGDAWLYGGKWEFSPLYIQGSRHPLFVPTPGFIQVGCYANPPEWWHKNARLIGRSNGYTKIQRDEYVDLLVIAERWMKRYKIYEEEK